MNSGLTIAAPSLAVDFQTNASIKGADRLVALAKKYGKHGALLKDGHLTLFLHTGHGRFGGELLAAVTDDPALREKISFKDRGRIRSYEDVVWNLEERGVDLARKIYMDANEGNKIRILVATPPRNTHLDAPRDVYCTSIFANGPHGTVQLRPLLETDFDWSDAKKHAGKYYMIQTDRVSLEPTDDPRNQTMRISTRTPFNYALDHAPRHEPHV